MVGLGLLIAAFAVSLAPAAAHGQSSSSYYVASLSGSLDPGAQDFLTGALSSAQSNGQTHFVLVLNTDTGDGTSLDNIVQAVGNYESAGGTFIVVIGPYGAQATSAGAYLAEAANQLYMMNGTVIGSAQPISSGTNETQAFTTFMQALASQFGRNATAAGSMVSQDASYTSSQAGSMGIITAVINSSSVSNALLQLGVPANTSVQSEGVTSQLISLLSDPDISAVLFLVGILAIMIDLYHPTFILSAAGAAAVVLALIGLGYFGAPLSAVILMVIGSAFIFLEVKTNHGVSAIGGVVIFIIGAVLIYDVPFSTTSTGAPVAAFTGPSPLTYAVLAVLAFVVVVGSVYLYRVRKDLMHRNKGRFDLKNMIGKEGVLTSDVKAGGVGSANIDSEDWSVTADSDLQKGARVKVKEVHGFTLKVEGI